MPSSPEPLSNFQVWTAQHPGKICKKQSEYYDLCNWKKDLINFDLARISRWLLVFAWALPCYTGSCSCQGKFVADQDISILSSAIDHQLFQTKCCSFPYLQQDPSLFHPKISLIWLEVLIFSGLSVSKHGWQLLFCLPLQVCGAQMIDPSNLGDILVRTAQLLCIGKLSHPSKIYHSAEKMRYQTRWITMEISTSSCITGDMLCWTKENYALFTVQKQSGDVNSDLKNWEEQSHAWSMGLIHTFILNYMDAL